MKKGFVHELLIWFGMAGCFRIFSHFDQWYIWLPSGIAAYLLFRYYGDEREKGNIE